jgi:hypothetical protein
MQGHTRSKFVHALRRRMGLTLGSGTAGSTRSGVRSAGRTAGRSTATPHSSRSDTT